MFQKRKNYFSSVIILVFTIFFSTASYSYSDAFEDAINLFDEATNMFEEAESAYTRANELSEMDIELMTVEELEEMTALFDEATEKFTSASEKEKRANEIMANAELEYESDLAPEPEPVLTEAEIAKEKSKSRAIAMRARARAKMLIDRTATEKKFIKKIQDEASKFDLSVSNSGRGPFFVLKNSFDTNSTQYGELFRKELNLIVDVMKSYPVYHLKIRTFATEYDSDKRNDKISKKRALRLSDILEGEKITSFAIEIETDKSVSIDASKTNVVQLIFFREEGYFRK